MGIEAIAARTTARKADKSITGNHHMAVAIIASVIFNPIAVPITNWPRPTTGDRRVDGKPDYCPYRAGRERADNPRKRQAAQMCSKTRHESSREREDCLTIGPHRYQRGHRKQSHDLGAGNIQGDSVRLLTSNALMASACSSVS